MKSGENIVMVKFILFLLLLVVANLHALEFDDIDGYEIPSICEDLPPNASTANLSAVCLAAQVAAQTWPLLLPAANQLCMILEGVTAEVEVAQLEINKIHEKCDVEFGKLENKLLSGVNSYHLIGTSNADLLIKINKIYDEDSLEEESLLNKGNFLGQALADWDEVNSNEDEPNSPTKNAKKRYLKKVAGAKYLGESQFKNNSNTQIIDNLQKQIKKSKSLKKSLDLSARISAELAFQQSIQSQLLAQLLDLKSSDNIKDIANETWVANFLKEK